MREGILSWLYTAWLIGILLAFKNVTSVPSAVNIIGVETLNSTSLKVTWNPASSENGSITGYTVCYQITPNVSCSNDNTKTESGNTLNTTLMNLNEATTYYIRARAFDNVSSDGLLGNEVNGTTAEDEPAKGPDVNVTTLNSTSLSVSWVKLSKDKSNGVITIYEVCYQTGSTVSDCSMSTNVSGVDNKAILTALKPYTMYAAAVRAFTKIGPGLLGDSQSATTEEYKPKKGPNVTVATRNSTALDVSWVKLSRDESNGNITIYEVCYQTGSTVPDCSMSKNISGVDNTTILTGLKPATIYTVAVRAFTKIGPGPPGRNQIATTNEDKPAKGPNVTVTTLNSTALNISWTKLSKDDSNGNITMYQVCYQTGSKISDCSTSKNVSGFDNRSTVLTGLKPSTIYTVAVGAFTKIGPGPLGRNQSATTKEDRPKKGPDAAVTTLNSTALNISWIALSKDDSNGKITIYQVCYQPGSKVPDCSTVKNISGVDNRATVLTGLKPATVYTVAVRAFTKIGPGPLGVRQNATTDEDRPKKGPNATVTSRNSTALNVSWTELSKDDSNGNITMYQVCYQQGSKVPDCSTSKNISGADNRATILTGLKPATMYTVAVRAFTKIGPGRLGKENTITTSDAEPVRGATVTKVRPVSSTMLEVSWEKLPENATNGNITAYRICFDQKPSSVKDCTEDEDVLGADNTTFNLTNLNEATTYYVAVKARTGAGFGPIFNIVNNKTLEAVPVKGPQITNVTAESSTSLTVDWKVLDPDNANGEIVNYAVCYKVVKSPGNICTSSKTVGNVLTLTLRGLEKYTRYEVAVRAATVIGFGPPGNNVTKQTKQDKPGTPLIRTISPDYNGISLNWSKPIKTNGEIKYYTVCWESIVARIAKTCRNETTTLYHIRHLKPGTEYDISVSATTGGGRGDDTTIKTLTLKSEIANKSLDGTMTVNDENTQIGFKLPDLSPSERSKITKFYVIVKRWTANDQEVTLLNTDQKTLTVYENSSNGLKPYIAIASENYMNKMEILVGDDKTYSISSRRKKRDVQEYRNAPLLEDTEYAVFVRAFYGDDNSFSNSMVLRRRTNATEGNNVTVIVVVVVVVIVAILVIIIGVLLLRRRKAHTHYNGIELETKAKPVVRYPIPINEFRAHCERLAINSGLGYQDEYESVRPKGPVSAETAKRQENVDKNRYNNIHAYDDSRVVLQLLDGVEGSDYINANHIDGYEHKGQFIAAQGTLKNTVVDFWRMIWEQKVSSIVMLANPIEKGREKLAVYWPQDRAVKHGPFMIKLDGEVELADYVIRKMTVTKDDVKDTRQLTQFHYTVWPDHGVPPYTTSLQAFLTRIRKSVRNDKNPLLVHCSAGVGRTGTFIGIFAMLDMIEATKTVDIFNFVCQMRTQRTHMVQVEAQYVFLHKAVLEAIECGDTEINAPDLRVKMNQLNRTDPENDDQTNMEKQFKVLEKYTFVKTNTEEGKKSFNVAKNRNKEILPYEDTRVPLLKSPGVDGSDYINASSIDSYQVRGMYIATQFPLENTVNDFWRMIWEKKSNCVVMLADMEENPESFQRYWTDKTNDSMLCGNLLVTLEKEEKSDEFVTRNFKLKKNDGGETREIWHFNLLTWTEDEVPKTTVGIRQMIGKIQDVQRHGGNNPIVVHCSDGGGRTGAFCALVTSLERVKQDQSFNLFQTIMLQRIQRPRMVTSVGQYKFCFQAILDFLDSFDEYANFQDLKDLRQ